MGLTSLVSNLTWYNVPPAVNNFPDETSGATGFTTYMYPIGGSAKPTQYLGVTGTTIQYPQRIFNSFNTLNLQDNSYNTTYIPQPYILRGIQRKNKSNDQPQYWGFGSKSGFDDGLIRGGAVTVADRVVADVERLGKFIASPKGLLWVTKQVGLGLSNPKVEVSPLAPIRQTRLHSGVSSLLSVPSTPIGAHFTTHGIPFLNEVASYENVMTAKKPLYNIPLVGNRLISLKQELGIGTTTSLIPGIGAVMGFINNISQALGFKGQLIESLSGLGGPQSVYGIGGTIIRRFSDSETDAKNNFAPDGDTSAFNKYNPFNRQFNSYHKGRTGYNSAVDKTGLDYGYARLGLAQVKSLKDKDLNTTPGNEDDVDLSTTTGVSISNPTLPIGDVNTYITLAYNKIPKGKQNSYTDFRDLISPSNKKETSIVGNNPLSDGDSSYYKQNNIENKYGLGNLGQPGLDRTNPYDYIVEGTKYDGTDRKILINTNGFRGDKINALDIGNTKPTGNALDYNDVYPGGTRDFIKFVFSDAEYGKNTMVFRATVKNISDSFAPGWDKLTIIGRPDGAYLYESFERVVSFTFTVVALSRAEMIPMWRKLNYLATYTMPDIRDSSKTVGKATGPLMRLTLGDMFNATPGFIESLTYSIPDDATWDIAEDTENKDAKELPMMVEAQMTFKIISDYRPQLMGRAYSLSPGGTAKDIPGQWLKDSLDSNS